MKNAWIVAKKDFKNYFTSPIAYIVIAGFLVIMGWMFFNILSYFNLQNARFQGGAAAKGANITDGIIRPLYGNMNVVLLFMVPFVTMRLFSEEMKNKTIAMLMTAPLTLWEIVIGKFLSAWMLIGVMILLTGTYPLIVIATGNPDLGPIWTSNLGTLLLAGCYAALGTFFSALTENQIIAGVLGIAAALFFFIVSWASHNAGPFWGEILNYVSLISHFNNFSQGLVSSTDVIYYLSYIFFGLFLTHRVLDSFRWR